MKCIAKCNKCQLNTGYGPQIEVIDGADIMWVGLSATIQGDKPALPLEKQTRSGKLIEVIDQKLELSSYKTNLVKCPPLKEKRLRYPNLKEMNTCYENLIREVFHVKPRYVVLLGLQVAKYISCQFGFAISPFGTGYDYRTYEHAGLAFIPIHHPSYILIYRRKHLDSYVKGVCKSTIH
jgi:DNA polymerase